MGPRREEPRREEPKAPEPRTEQKPKRFGLIKLEERIAPFSFNWGEVGSPDLYARH
jgi:hypothetical protein